MTWLRTTVGLTRLEDVASFEIYSAEPWTVGAELAKDWKYALWAYHSGHDHKVIVALWNDRDELETALEVMVIDVEAANESEAPPFWTEVKLPPKKFEP